MRFKATQNGPLFKCSSCISQRSSEMQNIPLWKFFRDLGEISARSRPRSRRDKNLGGQKRAEITGEISPRWKSRRPKTRRDYWRDLAEMKISAAKNAPRLLARSRRDENLAAKNAPRLLARSRRDENLGGQNRAEITGEISARKKSRRPKTRRD